MPIIACPSCQGKLRFPEDTPPRRVKCPTCGHVFLSSAGADPKAPVAAGSPGNREPRSDFEYDDRRDDDSGRGRRRRDDDDYDRRRRRDDDEDRDRRARRRGGDRGGGGPGPPAAGGGGGARARRSRRRDDDYDDRRRRGPDPRAIEGQFNRASLACLLCFVGGWLLVAGLGVMVLVRLLFWAD